MIEDGYTYTLTSKMNNFNALQESIFRSPCQKYTNMFIHILEPIIYIYLMDAQFVFDTAEHIRDYPIMSTQFIIRSCTTGIAICFRK